jgi:hypothetical protein
MVDRGRLINLGEYLQEYVYPVTWQVPEDFIKRQKQGMAGLVMSKVILDYPNRYYHISFTQEEEKNHVIIRCRLTVYAID